MHLALHWLVYRHIYSTFNTQAEFVFFKEARPAMALSIPVPKQGLLFTRSMHCSLLLSYRGCGMETCCLVDHQEAAPDHCYLAIPTAWTSPLATFINSVTWRTWKRVTLHVYVVKLYLHTNSNDTNFAGGGWVIEAGVPAKCKYSTHKRLQYVIHSPTF